MLSPIRLPSLSTMSSPLSISEPAYNPNMKVSFPPLTSSPPIGASILDILKQQTSSPNILSTGISSTGSKVSSSSRYEKLPITKLSPPSLEILVQSRPKIITSPEPRVTISPGLIPLIELPTKVEPEIALKTYNSKDNIIVVSEPYDQEYVYYDAQSWGVIEQVPSMPTLPGMIYRTDPTTGVLRRYLAVHDDPDYTTDTDYGINQQWLLNNRQGNEYDRVPEWVPEPETARETNLGLLGVTIANVGRVWEGPPRTQIISSYQDEYARMLEYSQTELDENDKYF